MAGLPDFTPLTTEAKQAQIENLHRQWTAPTSEINNRLSMMTVRSPDVLGVILGGKWPLSKTKPKKGQSPNGVENRGFCYSHQDIPSINLLTSAENACWDE